MKTVKIRCFSAINGEKTFVWNGLGEWVEPTVIRFQTDREQYRFAWTKTTVSFHRGGAVSLALELTTKDQSRARISVDGRDLHAECTDVRMRIDNTHLDVFYRMQGQDDTHRIHLDWTLEGRN